MQIIDILGPGCCTKCLVAEAADTVDTQDFHICQSATNISLLSFISDFSISLVFLFMLVVRRLFGVLCVLFDSLCVVA